jgi:hypothetical protein
MNLKQEIIYLINEYGGKGVFIKDIESLSNSKKGQQKELYDYFVVFIHMIHNDTIKDLDSFCLKYRSINIVTLNYAKNSNSSIEIYMSEILTIQIYATNKILALA